METLAAVNALDRAAFVAKFGHVFEHSPWVAERAWDARPFSSLEDLHAKLVAAMSHASREEQLALIRAHPVLGRLPPAGPGSEDSRREQGGAGLVDADAKDLAELARLNAEYLERFGFPFILAVRGLQRPEVLSTLAARLGNPPAVEFAQCLGQIERIARLRLGDLVEA